MKCLSIMLRSEQERFSVKLFGNISTALSLSVASS